MLAERAKFSVDLLSWAVQEDDGSILATVRITGPVQTALETLTVEFVRIDAEGGEITGAWVPLDVSDWNRGVPIERTISLPPTGGAAIEAIAIKTHPDPSERVVPHLVELRDLAAS